MKHAHKVFELFDNTMARPIENDGFDLDAVRFFGFLPRKKNPNTERGFIYCSVMMLVKKRRRAKSMPLKETRSDNIIVDPVKDAALCKSCNKRNLSFGKRQNWLVDKTLAEWEEEVSKRCWKSPNDLDAATLHVG